MLDFRELTLLSVPIRIAVALLLSGIIGMERGMKSRAAGFRTYMLVCCGSCIVMMTNQYLFQLTGSGDPMRMGAQVVSGIGFLGAGTIIVTSRNQIKGLTTAAGLWASACLGLAVGVGFYEVAIVGGVAVFLSLTVFHAWENRMRRNNKVLTLYVELHPGYALREFVQGARDEELMLSNLQMSNDTNVEQEVLSFLVTVKSRKKMKSDVLLKTVRKFACVSYLEEL